MLRIPLHEDDRGWFKENWQREKMAELGLPDFGPVQNNVSFNRTRGVTRGIHTEPWDKLVSVASGRVFAAWVDMRAGSTFGRSHHMELDPSFAVFVPRGVGNAFQTLEDGTAYSYLVNQHWRPGVNYPALSLDDPTAAIPWPIPLSAAEISAKDRTNPRLPDINAIAPRKTLIFGGHGQLGKALAAEFPDATAVDADVLDLTDEEAVSNWPWHEYSAVINAAAFTAVDEAETRDGRRTAWAVNAAAPAALAELAREHQFTLVHYSTDYVFDGSRKGHTERERLSPLGVYGQTKAAGDLAVGAAPRHYILRTSWLVGDGHNFVRTMAKLAADGRSPAVVSDQIGRLTFADELARATHHLLNREPTFGVYNCTSSGDPTSWADVARSVFVLCGRDASDITPTTTSAYAEGKELAPRPLNSILDLGKLSATGFETREWSIALKEYVGTHLATTPAPNGLRQ